MIIFLFSSLFLPFLFLFVDRVSCVMGWRGTVQNDVVLGFLGEDVFIDANENTSTVFFMYCLDEIKL